MNFDDLDSTLLSIHSDAQHSPTSMDQSATHMDIYEALGLNAPVSVTCKPASIACEQENDFLENITPNKRDDLTYVIEKNSIPLSPVQPFDSGEGLPYAPVDWPNPGDNWTWRVGKRVNNSGFYCDRYIFLPKSLQKPSSKRQAFSSKSSLADYIQSEFPDADIDAFFAAFSWQVPSTNHSTKKAEAPSLVPELHSKVQAETVEIEQKAAETANTILRKRKPRAVALAVSTTPKRQTRQNLKKKTSPISSSDEGVGIGLGPLGEAGEARKLTTKDKKSTTAVGRKNHIIKAPPAQVIPEEFFDNYLNSLDDILNQPLSEPAFSPVVPINSPAFENEMAESRRKLSSLLSMDFPSLVSSKHLTELANLVSKLQKDPSLGVDQLVKLKLIEEIPLISEVFQETQDTIDQADKFFADLEAKKAKVTSLKMEYSEFKGSADHLQSEIDSSSGTIQEIDDHIAKLESQRAELVSLVKSKKKTKAELKSAQKMVADSIPIVVRDIQLANSKKAEWEVKKENSVKREAEFLTRFAPLKGFSV